MAARVRACNSNISLWSGQNYWTVTKNSLAHSNSGLSTHSSAVCVTIFSNSSLIRSGFKELHALTLASCSYVLLSLMSYLKFMWWIVSEVSVSSVVSSRHTLFNVIRLPGSTVMRRSHCNAALPPFHPSHTPPHGSHTLYRSCNTS